MFLIVGVDVWLLKCSVTYVICCGYCCCVCVCCLLFAWISCLSAELPCCIQYLWLPLPLRGFVMFLVVCSVYVLAGRSCFRFVALVSC